MQTVIVPNPKTVERKEKLVLISQEEYQALLRIKKQAIQEAVPTAREKRAIVAGKKELRSGKYFSLNELDSYLGRARARARR